MDTDMEESELHADPVAKKTPRPSELAKKKAKPKSKAKAKKPAAKKKKKKAETARSVRKRVLKAAKAKKASGGVVRSQRIDVRLSKAEKAKLTARAKKLRRTITSVLQEMIEKLK